MKILRRLLIPAILITVTSQTYSGPLQQAAVNQIVNDVKVIDPAKGARPAALKEVIRDDLAVRTGIQSRTELLFQDDTLTRLGAETIFSFKAGTRDLSLDRGTMLLQVPKNHGGARIRTASVTASITGTTIMMEYLPEKSLKVVVLEGSLRLSPNGRLGEAVNLTAGRMIIMEPNAKRIPEPVKVDLRKLVNTSSLINPVAFKGNSKASVAALPSIPLIEKEIALQDKLVKGNELAGTNLVIPGSGTQVVVASDENLAMLDRGLVFDKGTVATANGQIEAPIPTRLPSVKDAKLVSSETPALVPVGDVKLTDPKIIPATDATIGIKPTAAPLDTDGTVIVANPVVEGTTLSLASIQPVIFTTPPPTTTTTGIGTGISVASPAFIANPSPYRITNKTTIDTAATTITTLGVVDSGALYQSSTLNGPASTYLFDTPSAFDAATNLDATFGARSGGTASAAGVAVYRFDGLQIDGPPTFQTAGGATDLALVSQRGIASSSSGSAWNLDSLRSLFFGTVDGPIGLTGDIRTASSGTGFKYLQLDARGTAGAVSLGGKIALPLADLYVDAEQGITVERGASLTASKAVLNSPGAIVLNESTTTDALSITSGAGVAFTKAPASKVIEVTAPRLATAAKLSTSDGFLNIGAGGIRAAGQTLSGFRDISVVGSMEAGSVSVRNSLDIGGTLMTASTAPTLISAASIKIGGGIDYSHVAGGTPLSPASGGTLTILADDVQIDPAGINGIRADGADALLSLIAGGGGGTVNVGTSAKPIANGITVNVPVTATTGANATGTVSGGNGGTVSLVANGAIDVNSIVKVSNSATASASRTGGSIKLDSRKTSGTAISISNSGQLLSLLNATATGTGGRIQFTSSGGDILVDGGTVKADRGSVDIRNNGAGSVALTNTAIRGDVVKVGALGPNGKLVIGGGLIEANTALNLYGGSSNGEVHFTGDVALGGNGVKNIAGKSVTIDDGRTVTIGGASAARVFTDNANYSGSGGNGATTGTIGGKGATTQGFGSRPAF